MTPSGNPLTDRSSVVRKAVFVCEESVLGENKVRRGGCEHVGAGHCRVELDQKRCAAFKNGLGAKKIQNGGAVAEFFVCSVLKKAEAD